MSALHDQHYLIDQKAIERIVGITPVAERRVLEIGPGTGNLTRALLDAGSVVIAVEVDHALCEDLARIFASEIDEGRLILLHGDASRCELPPFDLCVSNLPYSLSSKITFRLLDIGFCEAVLMYQKEFADRMLAPVPSPDCGRLSVMVQTFATASACFELSPNAFSPKPKVRSKVVRLVPREPPYPLRDRRRYADVVRALFSHRRKTVRNGMRRSKGILPDPLVDQILAALPESVQGQRPEELSLADFAAIANLG
jgi:16S rRNA (adenine1518-N6/adenine1519-N6)-dimethyltransferase